MADQNEPNNSSENQDPPNNSGGETNAEKLEREEREREENAAEQRIKGWIAEGVKEGLKSVVPSTQNPGTSSNSSADKKKKSPRGNVLEKILGIR